MSGLLIVQPLPFTVVATRGTGAGNLATRDPQEAWVDSASGSESTFYVDLGRPTLIDTVCLAFVRPPTATATWFVGGGVNAAVEFTLQPTGALRVPDVAGQFPTTSHALWFGAPVLARYVTILTGQPAGSPPLSVGVLVIGKAFNAELGPEWGFGRRPIDTGTATALASGGFAVVDGVKKVGATWTFGDLSMAEAEQLEAIALAVGQTTPALVVENADRTPGLRARIRYGLFKWKAFERRNRKQTRWEMEVEDWI